jgi:membrane protein implicated in regulation of membrane protease activity
MHTLHELYIQNPLWVWLAVGAVFIALDIALGTGKLVWGGVAAASLAFVNVAGVRLGWMAEFGIFAVVLIGGVLVSFAPWRAKSSAATHVEQAQVQRAAKPARAEKAQKVARVQAPEPPAADEGRTGRLIGRIGRTTSEFANGVGRVWIDGAEWGAELDGEETLPSDSPVRVMGVTGGVRLHVRNVMMG